VMNLKDDDLVSAVALVVDTGEETGAPVSGEETGAPQDAPADEES
jgi:hypothetical protein